MVNDSLRDALAPRSFTTFAGDGAAGDADGPAVSAEFYQPAGLTTDAAGNVYLADQGNNRVKVIDVCGNVTTLAGNGIAGFVDGSGGRSGDAELDHPADIGVDGLGNLFVNDLDNLRVRVIRPNP